MKFWIGNGFAGFLLVIGAATPVSATAQVRNLNFSTHLPPCEARNDVYPCGVIISGAGSDMSSPLIAGIAQGAGAQVRHQFKIVNAVAATIPSASVAKALSLSSVRVTPDRKLQLIEPLKGPSGGGGSGGSTAQVTPEGVSHIGSTGKTGSGVGVAIVDTGLDLIHADLSTNIASGGFDAYSGGCQDQNGHGTHVGGIVAALNNGIDVVGVAPSAKLYCVRVLDAAGSGSDSSLMAGYDWIWNENGGANASKPPKISVLNASLGRPGSVSDNPSMQAAIKKLKDQGVSVVVAAGNDANTEISQQIPAAYPEVMAVASATAQGGTSACSRSAPIAADTASYFTTDGSGVVVSAPGEAKEDVSKGCMISSTGILSLKMGGGTTRMSGTSMASPHVAGVAALIMETSPTSSPDCVRAKLQNGATNKGTLPLASPTGSYSFDGVREGVLSAPGALAAACP